MSGLTDFQIEVARLFFGLPGSDGFLLAGGGEQRVVALVAEGLTTRQIGDRLHISSFTVGSHLRHVYQKLGINPHVQLTRQVIRHGADNSW